MKKIQNEEPIKTLEEIQGEELVKALKKRGPCPNAVLEGLSKKELEKVAEEVADNVLKRTENS